MRLLAAFAIAALGGCAAPFVPNYLVLRDEETGNVMGQFTGLPCQEFVQRLIEDQPASARDRLKRVLSCSGTRTEAGLPYRMTLREKQHGFLVDIDVARKDICDALEMSGIIEPGMEVVAPCTLNAT